MQESSYETQAIERAHLKLDELRSGRIALAPVGPFWSRIVGGAILILFGVLLPVGAYALLADTGTDRDATMVAVGIFAVVGLLPALPGLVMVLTSTATTPMRALRLFFKAVGGGKFKRASALVIPNDLDDFPREYPDHPLLGLGGSPPYSFDLPADFADYWTGLVRYPTSPYCLVRISGLHVEEVAPDVVVAEFRLKLAINTTLWVLLLLVAWPAAIIVDLATRKRVNERMRKILIRVGDEWHLFSGEWQGPDEQDVLWLEGGGARGPR